MYSVLRLILGWPDVILGLKLERDPSDVRLDDVVERPEPAEERRARRQDVRRGDGVDATLPHRLEAVPAGAPPDGLQVHRLAAPRGHDDLRGSPDHLLEVDDAAPGVGALAKLREDVLAPGDLDQLRDPADPGDGGVVPLLEVDAGAPGPDARDLASMPDLVLHGGDQPAGAGVAAERAADEPDGPEDVGHAALVQGEHRHAGPDQIADDVSLEIGEREDQVGLERQDPVQAEGRAATHP